MRSPKRRKTCTGQPPRMRVTSGKTFTEALEVVRLTLTIAWTSALQPRDLWWCERVRASADYTVTWCRRCTPTGGIFRWRVKTKKYTFLSQRLMSSNVQPTRVSGSHASQFRIQDHDARCHFDGRCDHACIDGKSRPSQIPMSAKARISPVTPPNLSI